MIRFLTIIFCLMALSTCAKDKSKTYTAQAVKFEQPNQLDTFFTKADAFLSGHIKDGKVPYKAIKQEPAKLNELVNMIGNISLDDASAAEKKAFYINAYNISTINAIIENGIPSSPMDVDGFFNVIKHKVAGKQMTLDDIEKGTLFPEFGDARMHFAVVCAALGCPQIQPFAYMPDDLNAQLNKVAKEALNRDYFIRVDDENKQVNVSQIFKWYRSDFLKEADSVLAFINRYRDEKIPDDYSVGYYDYDWSLNSKK